jgi:hypothetical protein
MNDVPTIPIPNMLQAFSNPYNSPSAPANIGPLNYPIDIPLVNLHL